jgi:hypothetical protein
MDKKNEKTTSKADAAAGGLDGDDSKDKKSKSHKRQTSSSSNDGPSSDIKRKPSSTTGNADAASPTKRATASADPNATEKSSRKSMLATVDSKTSKKAVADKESDASANGFGFCFVSLTAPERPITPATIPAVSVFRFFIPDAIYGVSFALNIPSVSPAEARRSDP